MDQLRHTTRLLISYIFAIAVFWHNLIRVTLISRASCTGFVSNNPKASRRADSRWPPLPFIRNSARDNLSGALHSLYLITCGIHGTLTLNIICVREWSYYTCKIFRLYANSPFRVAALVTEALDQRASCYISIAISSQCSFLQCIGSLHPTTCKVYYQPITNCIVSKLWCLKWILQ